MKGFFGELKVRIYLAFFLGFLGFGYKRFHNVMIGFADGGSSQIDHIIVCKKGIFVIETKNYSGSIKASTNAKNWTQHIGGHEYQFYNPIRQNEGHLSSLRYLLKSKKYPMYNKVVFVGSAKFLGYVPKPVSTNIFELISDIESVKSKPLTSQQVKSISRKIKTRKLPNNWFTRRKHLKYVKSKTSSNKNS